ncbi:MAG: Ig-like domain repeat protein [Actinomycetota bacterium]|nr:Ig-like domain repeat protein [Actinomycetota bacterium]
MLLRLPRLHRRALAPALSLVLAAGGVTLTAAPATAAPRPAATTQGHQVDGLFGLLEAVVEPLISGLGGVGETLTLSLPEWNLLGVSNEVQWLSGGSPIPGATGTSFVPTLEQAGSAVQAQVTGTVLGLLPVTYLTNAIPIPLPGGGGGGGGGGSEDPTLEVLQDPSITGIPGVGSLLQILNPIWSLPGVATSYQWFVDNVPVPGATGPTFVPGLEDAGKQVHAVVTGTLAGLPIISALTNYLPIPAATEEPLAATSAATITGTVKVGKVVSVEDPSWNEEGVEHAYQWLRDGSPISGATAKTYTLTPEDYGHRILVKVTGSKDGWTDSTVDSQEVTPALGDALTFTSQPAVSGTVALGRTLTALPGAWGSGSTPTFGYQWRRGGQVITGATSSTYVVSTDDLGSTLAVTVTATRAAYAPGLFTTSALPVAKLASATTLKGKKKARVGKPVRVKVGVLVDGFAPDGVVSLLDGTKTLKRLRIARGTKKVKLPKLSKGKHVITAVYAGSDATEESRSKPLKLKVRPRR